MDSVVHNDSPRDDSEIESLDLKGKLSEEAESNNIPIDMEKVEQPQQSQPESNESQPQPEAKETQSQPEPKIRRKAPGSFITALAKRSTQIEVGFAGEDADVESHVEKKYKNVYLDDVSAHDGPIVVTFRVEPENLDKLLARLNEDPLVISKQTI